MDQKSQSLWNNPLCPHFNTTPNHIQAPTLQIRPDTLPNTRLLNLNKHLPRIGAPIQIHKRRLRHAKPALNHSLSPLNLPLLQPPRQLPNRARILLPIIKDNKPLHPNPHSNNHQIIPRPLGHLLIILADAATNHKARMLLRSREGQVQNLAADIVEEDVDERFCGGAEIFGETRRFVVEGGVEAGRLRQPAAFGVATGDTEDRRAFEFRDLPYDAACCAGGAGDDDKIAGFHLSDVEQAEIGRETRSAFGFMLSVLT
jgi:hypothetical protein